MTDYERFWTLFGEMGIPFKAPPIDPHTRYSVDVEVDAAIEINRTSPTDEFTFWFKGGRYVACETFTYRCVRDGLEAGKWMTDGPA